MTAPPAGALDLPEPYALEIGARFDQSGSVLMELIVEPTSPEWRGGDKQPLYTAEQMREYALLAALRLREGCQRLEQRWRHEDAGDAVETWGCAHESCADDLARVLEEGE
jgi:hypothetical protein